MLKHETNAGANIDSYSMDKCMLDLLVGPLTSLPRQQVMTNSHQVRTSLPVFFLGMGVPRPHHERLGEPGIVPQNTYTQPVNQSFPRVQLPISDIGEV